MNGAVLKTSGLGVSFGEFRAVSNVDLHLEPGARQALIGPNGAGKTTLINLLTGVLRPTQGSIHLGEQELTHVSPDRRARLGVSRTFQINTLFPNMTPLQSVVAAISERDGLGGIWWRALRKHGVLFDEAAAILHRLRLHTFAHTRVAELPYGKQRLLEIAMAMAARPKILLLDEPAAGVPEDESGELFEVIAELPSHMSILFIEHDMDLVFRFAQRISVLVAGQLLLEGTPSEIATDPQVRQVYLGPHAEVAYG
jgi:branched-chain amino acid transport system ATP-binding protein